jgi:UMF1 family MFS transporter
MPVKNRKEITSWCLFDFANSSYSAVIAAVIFPVYFASQVVGNETGLGDLWWGRAVSLSMAIVSLTSPFIGGIADYGGIRKRLLFAYTGLCIIMVTALAHLRQGAAMEGFILITLANVGMEGGLVFYNSFLPEIAEKEYQGRVSAWGFAVGYAGSILSLVLALPLVTRGCFGATWLMVALFFGIFSLPAFFYLPADRKSGVSVAEAASKGFRYTWNTLREILAKREARKFLIAYLIYEDGVNTVIVFSSIFAATTLGFSPQELIGLYLVVQCTALVGSLLMARPVDYWGPRNIVTLSLLMWTMVSIIAFFVVSKLHFWVLACIAGLGLGTVQAATRAFYAQFIPSGHESEYFGVYSMVGKTSAVIGPLVFGTLSSTFGSQRPAILSVAAFFLAGMGIIHFVRGGEANIRASS